MGLAHEGVADDGHAEGLVAEGRGTRRQGWSVIGCLHRCAGLEGAQEREAVAGQVVGGGGQRPPDRRGHGDGGVVGGEALDVQRAGVADLVQGGEQRRPVGLVAAGGATVAAADLDVHEVLAGPPDGVGAGALLDVEVVGVEGEPERRRRAAGRALQRLVDGVDQRGLVAVERLDPDPDTARRGVRDDGCEVGPPLVVRRRTCVSVEPPGPRPSAHRRARTPTAPRSPPPGRRRHAGSPACLRRSRRRWRPGRVREPSRRRRTASGRSRRAPPASTAG